MLEDLHKDSFEACLHTDFQVIHPEEPFDLELVEVSEQASSPRQETFSIIFHGPAESPLQQGMVSLSHEKLGQFALFLVPIARDPDGFRYEAVFNRLIPAK